MKQKKWATAILVTVFTAGLAGITISQTGMRRAQPYHWQTLAAPRKSPLVEYAEQYPDEAQFYLTDSPRPSWPSPSAQENMTPQEKEQLWRKFAEDRLREGLSRAGYTQDDVQDAAVDLQRILEADRRAIREKGGKLRGAVADGSSEAQIGALLYDLRKTITAARTRRDHGRKDLNTKIGFTKKPKLDAVLAIYGLGGDESLYLISSFGGFSRRGRDSNSRR